MTPQRSRIRPVHLAVVAALLVLVPVSTYALGANRAAKPVTACRTASGLLVVPHANGTCPAKSTKTKLGVKGPRGLRGPKGAAGAAAPKGFVYNSGDVAAATSTTSGPTIIRKLGTYTFQLTCSENSATQQDTINVGFISSAAGGVGYSFTNFANTNNNDPFTSKTTGQAAKNEYVGLVAFNGLTNGNKADDVTTGVIYVGKGATTSGLQVTAHGHIDSSTDVCNVQLSVVPE